MVPFGFLFLPLVSAVTPTTIDILSGPCLLFTVSLFYARNGHLDGYLIALCALLTTEYVNLRVQGHHACAVEQLCASSGARTFEGFEEKYKRTQES